MDHTRTAELVRSKAGNLFRFRPARATLLSITSLTLVGGALLSCPASAQALRASSANSVATGASIDRNSLPSSDTTGLPGTTERQSTSTGSGAEPGFTILGMPLRVAAPVAAPYNAAAEYDNFGGQPMRGGDAVLQQSIDGAP